MDRNNSVEIQKIKMPFFIGNAFASEKVALISGWYVFMSTLRQLLGSVCDYTGFHPLTGQFEKCSGCN